MEEEIRASNDLTFLRLQRADDGIVIHFKAQVNLGVEGSPQFVGYVGFDRNVYITGLVNTTHVSTLLFLSAWLSTHQVFLAEQAEWHLDPYHIFLRKGNQK